MGQERTFGGLAKVMQGFQGRADNMSTVSSGSKRATSPSYWNQYQPREEEGQRSCQRNQRSQAVVKDGASCRGLAVCLVGTREESRYMAQ